MHCVLCRPVIDFAVFCSFVCETRSVVRGHYQILSEEKLAEIGSWIDHHPDAKMQRLCRRFHLRRRTAYRLYAERLSYTGKGEYHPRAKRGRPSKMNLFLHTKIRSVLDKDSTFKRKEGLPRLFSLHSFVARTRNSHPTPHWGLRPKKGARAGPGGNSVGMRSGSPERSSVTYVYGLLPAFTLLPYLCQNIDNLCQNF